jgi:hypothetical protein
MTHRIAVALAAIVFSLTIGVLVGVVVHTSAQQRAENNGSNPSSPALIPTDSLDASSSTVNATGLSSNEPDPSSGTDAGSDPLTPAGESEVVAASTVAASPSPSTTHPTRSTASTQVSSPSSTKASAKTSTTTTSRSAVVVYTTIGTPPAPPPPDTPTKSSTSSQAHPSSSPVPRSTPPPTSRPAGGNVPGAPCSPLGAKSSTASGATLFCQRDQHGRRGLSWRAVVEGGGCLNVTMTGIGLDGHHYVCRRGPFGLNHWVRVD